MRPKTSASPKSIMFRIFLLLFAFLFSSFSSPIFAEEGDAQQYLLTVEVTQSKFFRKEKSMVIVNENTPSSIGWTAKEQGRDKQDATLSIQITPSKEEQGCVPIAVVAKRDGETVLDVETSVLLGEKAQFGAEELGFSILIDEPNKIQNIEIRDP